MHSAFYRKVQRHSEQKSCELVASAELAAKVYDNSAASLQIPCRCEVSYPNAISVSPHMQKLMLLLSIFLQMSQSAQIFKKSVGNDPSGAYNMDETGLFCRALPRRTLARVTENIHGSKVQKNRMTFAITTCMDGSHLSLHGISSAAMLRAVEATHTTPNIAHGSRWTSNKKG